ncbi:MAG: helix-turn-helix transcriptional regulator [Acidobacteria bacterium]|nr:helix-turn-helix transcriptional regulator [Acidobacteriota bacterium]
MDPTLDRELKKGSAELLLLACLEGRPRHGYEVAKRIAEESDGAIRFNVASLYGLLYRLESRGGIRGRWIEAPGERRRRIYTLTPAGRATLAEQREGWKVFAAAVSRIAGVSHG